MNSDSSSGLLVTATNHQQTTVSTVQQASHSVSQPVSESWCLTSVKVIKVQRRKSKNAVFSFVEKKTETFRLVFV